MPLVGVLHRVSREISLLSCLTCVMVNFTRLDIWLDIVLGCLFVKVFPDEMNTWVGGPGGAGCCPVVGGLVRSMHFLCCPCSLLTCVQLFVTHGLWHARLPCPSPSLGVCSNPCPLGQWWSNHLILCCSLLLPSTFPSIRVFSNDSALHSGGQSIWNFHFSISPSNECWGLILWLTGLVSLKSKRFSWVFCSIKIQKHQPSSLWFNSHIHRWLLEKL